MGPEASVSSLVKCNHITYVAALLYRLNEWTAIGKLSAQRSMSPYSVLGARDGALRVQKGAIAQWETAMHMWMYLSTSLSFITCLIQK